MESQGLRHGRISYREWLLNELASRQSRNPRFSVRAFASFLGINKTTLSEVLTGKRHLSRKNAVSIAERMELGRLETAALLKQIDKNNSPGMLLKANETAAVEKWYHFALLNLAQQKNCSASAEHLASRLGLSKSIITNALETLERSGLLKVENEKLMRTSKRIEIYDDEAEVGARQIWEDALELARKSLDNTEPNNRDFVTTVISFDPKNLKGVKKEIDGIRMNFEEKFGAGENGKEVYMLAMQFFPLTDVPR